MDVRFGSIARQLAVAVAIVGLALVSVGAQSRAAVDGQQPATPHAGMMDHCQQMMAAMASNEQALSDLVAKMNAATGDERVDAIRVVVNELASRQLQMRKHMTGMMNHSKSGPPATPDPGHSQHHPEK